MSCTGLPYINDKAFNETWLNSHESLLPAYVPDPATSAQRRKTYGRGGKPIFDKDYGAKKTITVHLPVGAGPDL
jgi:hypothetical protein